jgi:hypothetical protein
MLERIPEVPGERLDADAYLRDFWPCFERITDRFWKFERAQSFQEPGNPSWEALNAGDWTRALQLACVPATKWGMQYGGP